MDQSNYNDNSYYSYNNDSNVSFKRKKFKTKRFDEVKEEPNVNNENGEHLNEHVFGNSNNYVNDNANSNANGNVNNNLNELSNLNNGIVNVDNSLDNTDNFEKKREELCVLESLKYVNDKYPLFVKLNEMNRNVSKNVMLQQNPRFFVIKSFTEEDIHKSIKYSCWSSTKEGNKKLDRSYIDGISQKSSIFLFFSMNTSGRFTGVAKINGRLEEEYLFEYWAVDEVWKGLFPVEWIIIKDIPNRALMDVKLR